MTIVQLHYLITIASCGSLSGAAETLYVSQPTISTAIKELENELSLTIFHRHSKGVTLTPEGADFLRSAKELYLQYEDLMLAYKDEGTRKQKFAVSMQHYSFAVKAFVELAKSFDMSRYEFAIRETQTREVISDVRDLKSELGILYLSEANHKPMKKLLQSANLRFYPLIECQAYVYLWREHPLAQQPAISFEELADYPCLAFEQGDDSAFYLAEEILSTNEYPQIIRANDRATMLNLMIGLNGYTLCSGIISQELNGSEYVAIPFAESPDCPNSTMEIGYIMRENMQLSQMGKRFLTALRSELGLEPVKETIGE